MMKMTTLEIFPVLFHKFIFSQDQIIPLCEKIQDKKEIIKKRYNEEDIVPVIDYWTDYSNSVELLEYEKLIEEISSQFLPELRCEHVRYWTAIYGERGFHETHKHNDNLYNISRCNMSSVLSLSDIGQTEFFNPRQSAEIHTAYGIPSEMGSMIMFPAHILHRALPHGKKDEERIVVSSNWQVHTGKNDLYWNKDFQQQYEKKNND